jgi:Bacterial Ig domain
MKLLVCFILFTLYCSACKKNKVGEDLEPPMVTLTSPMNMASFPSSQNVPIRASISDNDTLESIHVNIEGPDFIHYAYAASGKNHSLSEDIPVPIKGKYSVSIEAHDKAGNHGLAKVEITVN